MGEIVIPSMKDEELLQISEGYFDNLSYPLTHWHRPFLENITEVGIQCLIYMWFTVQPKLIPGTYCNATWDNFYCWPPTPPGDIVTRPCSLILGATHHNNYEKSVAQHIKGQAMRVCLENATWLWGSWTNYSTCADSLEEYERRSAEELEDERYLVFQVRYILFIGSIVSFICLSTALTIFYYFKCLRCDRVTVHVHLMVALTLRCILLVIITEPFIFNRTNHYRNYDFWCKVVLSINLYATVASILWMFLQGVYLHGKLTTNVFDKGTPFKIYYIVGWGLPLGLICAWATVMQLYYDVDCWKDYSEEPYIWILLGPMICALVTNLLFLINIMRILLTKIQFSNSSGDAAQFRRAVKATMLLFPLLGINNLLFLYNPGGVYKRTFVILNTIFQSTQGIFVSVLYCFMSSDVRDAIRRKYRRFAARRSANSVRRNARGNRSTKYNHENNTLCTNVGEGQQALFITPTHFRSKFKGRENSRSKQSKTPSPETINNVLPSETPSPPSSAPVTLNKQGENLQNAAAINSSSSGCGVGAGSCVKKDNNRYQVSIPMRDFNLLKKN